MINIGMHANSSENFNLYDMQINFDASTSMPKQEEVLAAFEDVLVKFNFKIYIFFYQFFKNNLAKVNKN